MASYTGMITKLTNSTELIFSHIKTHIHAREEAKVEITSIVVPIDFSHHAKDAVEIAIEFAIACRLTEITLLHLFKLPSGYSKNGKCEEEFC